MSDPQQSFFEWEDANPLLQGIQLGLTFQTLGLLLPHDPKLLWEGEAPAATRIPRLIGRIEQLYVVTRPLIEFSLQFMGLLIQGLEARDPRIAQNRSRLYETGRFKGLPLSKLPWSSGTAAGMVLEGMTGVCKTYAIRRVLQFLPQVINHAASEEYGWKKLDQLVYLVVPMPSSARLGAFLLEVAMQMDKVLGTTYTAALRGRDLSDDKRAVLVLHWLSIHRCGMLVIEECQERNLPRQVFGSDFLSLFLRTMNWGIPVCVVGNPKALGEIRTFTQDGRRFGAGHWFTFEPVWDFRASIWRQDLVPGIWGWSPVPADDQHIPNLEQYLWKKTGGVVGLLVLLRKESLLFACRAGRSHVLQADVEAAFSGRAMTIHHPLIEALTTFDAGRLAALTDVPGDAIVARWQELGFLTPPRQEGSPGAAYEPALGVGHGTSKVAAKRSPVREHARDRPLKSRNASEATASAEGGGTTAAPTGREGVQKEGIGSLLADSSTLSQGSPAKESTDSKDAGEGSAPAADSAPVEPPTQHAPDQHVDRRSAAFKQLLERRPSGRR